MYAIFGENAFYFYGVSCYISLKLHSAWSNQTGWTNAELWRQKSLFCRFVSAMAAVSLVGLLCASFERINLESNRMSVGIKEINYWTFQSIVKLILLLRVGNCHGSYRLLPLRSKYYNSSYVPNIIKFHRIKKCSYNIARFIK